MVISTITLLNTIHKQTTESTGTLLNALATIQTTINELLWKAASKNITEPLPTTTGTLQTIYWRQQQDRQTIENVTNFTNNRPTHIWLTKDGSQRTNHVLQSLQPITSQLNWKMTSTIANSSTNQDNDQRLLTSTEDSQFTWLWWRFLLRLSKRQSTSPQTVLERTTLTQTITLHQLMTNW